MKKIMLVVIDLVRGFIKEGALAAPEMERVVPNVAKLVEQAHNAKQKVVLVRAWHSAKSEEFLKWPKHCVAGSNECLFVPEIEPYQRFATVINKDAINAFTNDKFPALFKNNVYDEIVVTGVLTEICVFQTCVSLISMLKSTGAKTKLIVPKNAVDTFNKPGHSANLVNDNTFVMFNKLGIHTPDSYKI